MPQSAIYNNWRRCRGLGLNGRRAAADQGPTVAMRWIRFIVLALLLAAPQGAARAGVTVPEGFPPSGTLVYDVIRDNAVVGSNRVVFENADGRITVRTAIDIVVSVVFVPVYRFTHRSEEVWLGGVLQSFKAQTDDDGRPRDIVLARDGDKLSGFYNGKPVELPGTLMPGSLWHPATIEQSALLETTKGRMREVAVEDLGMETLTLPSGAETAHHYSITGEMRREVWYGADGQVVQANFPAKDGSIVWLKLRR
jgi:hypothetical protein